MKLSACLLVACYLISSPIMAQNGTRPLLQVTEFGHYQPVGVAISSKGRLFVGFPKWTDTYQYGLVELLPNGERKPFPDAEWNRPDSTALTTHFVSVQALFCDAADNLWVLDPANPYSGSTKPTGLKLLKINLTTNQVERTYQFDDLPLEKASLNDVQVDAKRQVAYLSDPGRAAIVVLDLKTGQSRSLLEAHASTTADPKFVLTIDGQEVRDSKGHAFASNVNGIALTADGNYLYYRPITQNKLFRIPTEALRNTALSPNQVASQVQTLGEVGVSHGMIADRAGNVYMGDSQLKVIRRYTAKGKLQTLTTRDERLLWPDSFALSPDGYLYVTAAQNHRLPRFNGGQDKVQYPYRLYKIKL